MGCNKSDDKGGDDTPTDVSADVTYYVEDQADMLLLFDINVEYKDANGTQTTTITSLPWNTKVSIPKLPFSAYVKVSYTAKTDYPQKDTYTVGSGSGIGYKTSQGSEVPWSGMIDEMTLSASHIEAYISRINGTSVEASQDIAAN
jgi:hypothetical protein